MTAAKPWKRTRRVVFWICQKCGHEWHNGKATPPRNCAKCKAAGWQNPICISS